MGLLDRIGMVAKSNLNALVTAAEDPEKILEQTIIDMQEDLVQLRQAVAQSMAALKRQEQQYTQAQTQATEWERRAMLALQKGDEGLAREALTRKKSHADTAATLKTGLDQQSAQVELLKRNLISIESKISEAKTKKEMLKARIQSAKAQENINNMLGKVSTTSAAAVFERMEERVLLAEAKANASSELGMDNLESQFAKLELESGGGAVDLELEALKAQMGLAPAKSSGALPPADANKPSVGTLIDSELDALRQQLGK
ncbi:phage shock protein A (IM30), suppresses sigma54-dependent transcription [Synechococcus sp. PCC 7502]|uniref:PspA/IM30 family protein n=1 Tax=Synechococcus sp. PCC 7502 TaxID=1173263 RepID=UPI00029FE55C|nr:PspA/IM30 family protein [Synechococcus sp. PCC 7502]AFY74609.1 phage shock protein A (IM30), suppresses sigma54-dependent transcription [Synechococcus sp. PCC 7502]